MKRLLAVTAVAFLAGCATQQRPILTWDAVAIAQSSASTIRLNNRDAVQVATVRPERVRRIVDATRDIERVAGVNVRVFIIEGQQPNAFAARSGGVDRIAFTLGMTDLLGDDTDAYAAIIGHELAHLVLNHGALRKDREDTRVGVSTMLGFALGAVGVPMGSTIANVATQTVTTVFSRDEERDADSYGIRYARLAGYDPQGAVRAWEKMEARSSASLLPFLSTHPAAQERLDTMRQLAASPSPATAERPTSVAAPTSTQVAMPSSSLSTGFVRLRPIGQVAGGEALPAGDLYVDMNTVGKSSTHSDARQGWLVINLATPNPQRGRSYKALAIVRCPSTIAITQTTRAADLNGEGKTIVTAEHTGTFEKAEPNSVLLLAAQSICE
jgi:Zn-dependent protease with chaperone function